MTPLSKLEGKAAKIGDLYAELESNIFKRIIDAVKSTKFQSIDQQNVLLWQAEQLNKMGLLTQQVISLLANTTGQSEQAITDLIQSDGMQVSDDVSKECERLIGHRVNVTRDAQLLLNGLQRQTFRDINNVVNQSLISTNVRDNTALQAFQTIITKSTVETISGLKTHNRAVFDNIYKLMDAGLKTTLIDKGGHQWSLEGYSRMVLQTTAHRTYNDVRAKGMDGYNVTLSMMSSHPAAREACAPIQGHVVNRVPRSDPRFNKNYSSLYDYGYGEPAGTQGINCHHILYPYVEGVSTNTMPKPPDPDEAIANSKIQARQRLLERNIRKDKQLLAAADKLGDEQGSAHYKHQLFNHRSLLRQHISEHDFLHRDYSREKVVTPLAKDYNKIGKKFQYARNEVNPDKFNRHIVGTKEYDQYLKNRLKHGYNYPPSQLHITPDQARIYINRYGVIDSTTKSTVFNAGKTIATFIDQDTGERIPTSIGLISYSRSGAHITPLDPRKEHDHGR